MVTLHPKDQLFYTEQTEDSPDVSQEQLEELQALASQVSQLFGPFMDMEFTFANGQLYLLQARLLPPCQRDSKLFWIIAILSRAIRRFQSSDH